MLAKPERGGGLSPKMPEVLTGMGGFADDAERREARSHAERGNEKPVLSVSIGLTGASHPDPLTASGASGFYSIGSLLAQREVRPPRICKKVYLVAHFRTREWRI